MIPAWLLRALPHLAIVAAIVGAVWWLDAAGYRRAMAERDRRDAALLDTLRRDLRARETALASSIDEIARGHEAHRAALARTATSLQPIIARETAHDPRLANPDAGLTPGLLDAVNRARAAGACAASASERIDCALPAPAAGARPVDR